MGKRFRGKNRSNNFFQHLSAFWRRPGNISESCKGGRKKLIKGGEKISNIVLLAERTNYLSEKKLATKDLPRSCTKHSKTFLFSRYFRPLSPLSRRAKKLDCFKSLIDDPFCISHPLIPSPPSTYYYFSSLLPSQHTQKHSHFGFSLSNLSHSSHT